MGETQEQSFQDLMSELLSPFILRFPDSLRAYYLQTDASLDKISHILEETDEQGRKYIVSYVGKGLRPCEKKRPIAQLECYY